MTLVFYVASAIAIASSVLVIINRNPVHALLYLVLSLLAMAGMFFALGAPFAGALQVIVYAGAIMVLFVFVVMMLNLGEATARQERLWLSPRAWIGPGGLAAVLLAALLLALAEAPMVNTGVEEIDAKAVGIALFGPYLLAVELASMLLLAALVAAYHLGQHDRST